MNQFGLNNLMALHIHKQITDDLNSKDVADNFVSDSFRVAAQIVAIWEAYIDNFGL